MKITLVQMTIQEGKPQENSQRVLTLLEKAIRQDPDIIVLPEMWNTGYALGDLDSFADRDGEKTKQIIGDFAKKHAVYVLAGSVATKKAGKFYNTSYVFNRDGHLISEYDKVHLFGLMAENQFLEAGSTVGTFDLDDIIASHVICYDIRFPEWVRTLMANGSQILFVVAEWPEQRIAQWEILLKARAVENQAFVVAVNRVGQGQSDQFSGHSLVINPMGQIVYRADDHQESVVTISISLDEVRQTRGNIPVFADRRPDLYH